MFSICIQLWFVELVIANQIKIIQWQSLNLYLSLSYRIDLGSFEILSFQRSFNKLSKSPNKQQTDIDNQLMRESIRDGGGGLFIYATLNSQIHYMHDCINIIDVKIIYIHISNHNKIVPIMCKAKSPFIMNKSCWLKNLF